MEQQNTQSQQQQLSVEGLRALYTDFGDTKHALYEANARLAQMIRERDEAFRLLEELRQQYGPKDADGEAQQESGEPVPINKSAGKKGG